MLFRSPSQGHKGQMTNEKRARVERVLVLVGAEPLPAKANHCGVVDPDEDEDEERDEVGHCDVSPVRFRISSCSRRRARRNAPEPRAANSLDREDAERVARSRADLREVVGDVDGE